MAVEWSHVAILSAATSAVTLAGVKFMMSGLYKRFDKLEEREHDCQKDRLPGIEKDVARLKGRLNGSHAT